MIEIAILKIGIQNELRLNQLPVQAFGDDIVLLSFDIEVLHSMLCTWADYVMGWPGS